MDIGGPSEKTNFILVFIFATGDLLRARQAQNRDCDGCCVCAEASRPNFVRVRRMKQTHLAIICHFR